ncbi:putative Ig domain-containing protein [Mammaliicoccus sciuri]|uniref:putative Ig domain-containing protein n=1 Tax=Mammaliicoccus sciuri TaxID=1296 RepID=UPI001FB200FB|nr:putative Ig domain-containing protein [Mammaliicoccus sciuri]MCJ1775576.1 putative Ig domain-containing protein [Mammaliicoccus sciuri]
MFKNNRYSIRKFSVGTGSVIIGAMLYLSTPNIVNAEESNVLKEESQSTESTTNADSNKNIETSNETNETNTKEESAQDLTQKTSTENPTTENDTAESNTSEENAKEDKEEQSDFTIDPINNQTVKSNEAINPIKINVEGSENNTNQVQGLPDGLTYDSSTDTITGNPTTVGNYTITVISKNDSAVQKETTFTINVEEGEEPSTEEPQTNKDSKSTEENTTEEPTSDEQKSKENSTNQDSKEDNKDTTEEPKSTEEETLEEPTKEEPLDNNSEQPDTANNDLSTGDSEDDNNIDPNVDATDLKTTKPLTDKEKEDIDQKSKNKSKTDKNLKALSASSSKVEKEATKADGSPLGGDDVNSKIKSSNVKFEEGTWKKGAAFEIGFDISIPNDVKRNDYFTVHIPKEINPTSADRDNGILLGNDANSIYAKGTYNRADNSFTFKFTDNIEKYKNTSAHVDFLGLINFKEATKTDNYNLNLKIGDSEYNATRTIEYSTDARNLDLYQDSSVQEKVDDHNPYNTTYTVNGKARTLNNAKVKITPYSGTKKNPDVISQFNKDITKVQILKVTDRNTLNQSGSDKNVAYVDVSSPHNIIFNSDGSISIDLGNTNSTYLIVVNSETSKPFVPETFIEGTIQLSASNIASGSSQSKIGKSKPSSNNSSGVIVDDTTPPVVDKVDNQTTEVNSAIDPIVINANDNSGEKVRNDVFGLPDGVTYNSETNTISGTPTKAGTYEVTVISSDKVYNETETTFTITVEDTIAPTVDPIENQTTEVNTPITDVTLNGKDNSGDPVTHNVTGLPDGVTYNEETNTISGTPTKAGNYNVTVITSDEAGNETETTFAITVEDTTAPTIDPVDNQTTEVNTPITDIKLTGKDNSGDPVRHDVTGLPDGVTYNEATQTISGTPTTPGNYEITIVTRDDAGNSAETIFTITVEDTLPPTVDPVEDQTTEVNTPIEDITLNGKDNSGQPVTHEVSGLPEGVTYDPETNTISGTPTTVGNYDITVVSTDESGNTTETTFTITVEDTIPPTVDPVEDQTTEVNTPITDITLSGEDNSGQPVSHIVSGLPDGVVYDEVSKTISGTPTKTGDYNITVVTRDEAGNETKSTFTITVEDTTAPDVDPVDDQTTEVNTPIKNVTLNSKDNSGKPVTHEVSGLPEGVTYDSETNTISGTPTTVGSYDVTVVTTDESGNKTETTFTITVEDTTSPDVDPVEDQTTEVNTPITSIELNGKDNSGKPVTHEVSGLPEGVTYDSETNTISGTPTTVGSYEVTVISTDESGNTTETTFTITVEDTTAHEVSGLPDGVTYDPETNIISGTPTTVGSYDVTVVTTDESGNKTETTFTITVEDTTAPTVDPVDDQTTEVNTPIKDVTLNGQDNSGIPVKHEVSGLPEGVTYDSETNTISGTPTTVGSYDVTVISTDESGNTTETTFTITVEDTLPPTVDPIEDQTTEVNTPITSIELNGQDNSGKPVTHEVSGLPEGVTYDPETNTISGTPTTVDSYDVTVVTTDESGNKTETTFTITVEDTTAPVVDPVEDQTTEVNTPIKDVTLNGKDNSDQPVTHEVSGLPEGVTYDSETNTISGTPTTVGSYDVTVVTTDESGNKTETTFTITVEDTTAPEVDPVEDQTTEVNTPITSIELNGQDNSGKPVTHEVSGLPEGVTYDPETNTISGTPTTVGSYDVTVISTDESGNKTETTFTITVEDTLPPTVDPIEDQTTEVNTPIKDVTLNGKDNSGKPVTHEVSGLPEGVTYDPETNTISGTPTTVGSYEVIVVSTDESGNKTETSFTITVEDTTAPVVDPVEDQTTEVNTPIKDVTLNGKDNSDQPVTHEVSGLPEGVTYDSETNTISGTPTTVGSYDVTVVTTDESGNKTETTFTITVEDTTAPEVDPVDDQTTEVHTPITNIELNGKDNSGKSVTHEVSGLPEGVTYDSETNTISGTPTTVGSYDVTVISTDESGNKTETTFTITVEDTLPPTVDPIEDQTTEVNTPIEDITLNGQDNSGKPVTHEVSGLPEGVTYDPETNTISGTPTTVGSYEVIVVSTDESGNKTETSFTITVEDTTAPTVDPIEDQTTEVNTPIKDVTLNGKDNSGKPVTHEVSGLPDGVTFDPETNTISGTPTKAGEYTVTVVTRDSEGNETTTTFVIIVKDDSSNDGNNPGDDDGDDNSGDNGDDSSNGGNDNSGDNGDDSSNGGNDNSGDNGDDSSNGGNDNSGDNGDDSSNGGNDNSGDNGDDSSNGGNNNSGDNGINSSKDGNNNSGDNGDDSSNGGNDSKVLPDTGEQDKNLTLFASVIALFGGILTFRRKKKDSKTDK